MRHVTAGVMIRACATPFAQWLHSTSNFTTQGAYDAARRCTCVSVLHSGPVCAAALNRSLGKGEPARAPNSCRKQDSFDFPSFPMLNVRGGATHLSARLIAPQPLACAAPVGAMTGS